MPKKTKTTKVKKKSPKRSVSKPSAITEDLVTESEVFKSLNYFVLGVSQEIKHPLNGVVDRLQGVHDKYSSKDFEYIGYKDFKDIFETIESIKDQVQYCYDTTTRLLNLTKRGLGGLKQRCQVNEVIRNTINIFDEQFLQPNTKISLRLAAKLPEVSINNLEFSQAIVNVLTNAIQSMPGGGVVKIKTFYNAQKRRVCVQFHDEGIGIKKENLKNIFKPFFTTKQRGLEKSSGLGLSIVYSIIKAHRGEIYVKSNLRQGTVVTLELCTARSKKNSK